LGIFPIPWNRAKLNLDENEKKVISNAIFIDTPNSLDTFSLLKVQLYLIHQNRLNIHLSHSKIDLILKLSQDISNNSNPIYPTE